MDKSPMLRELLTELLALNDEDAQLPVPVLVNLHRPQLRVPLQRATTIGDEERDGSLHEAA